MLLTTDVVRWKKRAFSREENSVNYRMKRCVFWRNFLLTGRFCWIIDVVLLHCTLLFSVSYYNLSLLFLLQTEIAKRLNAICAQIIPFLSQEVSAFIDFLSTLSGTRQLFTSVFVRACFFAEVTLRSIFSQYLIFRFTFASSAFVRRSGCIAFFCWKYKLLIVSYIDYKF